MASSMSVCNLLTHAACSAERSGTLFVVHVCLTFLTTVGLYMLTYLADDTVFPIPLSTHQIVMLS